MPYSNFQTLDNKSALEVASEAMQASLKKTYATAHDHGTLKQATAPDHYALRLAFEKDAQKRYALATDGVQARTAHGVAIRLG